MRAFAAAVLSLSAVAGVGVVACEGTADSPLVIPTLGDDLRDLCPSRRAHQPCQVVVCPGGGLGTLEWRGVVEGVRTCTAVLAAPGDRGRAHRLFARWDHQNARHRWATPDDLWSRRPSGGNWSWTPPRARGEVVTSFPRFQAGRHDTSLPEPAIAGLGLIGGDEWSSALVDGVGRINSLILTRTGRGVSVFRPWEKRSLTAMACTDGRVLVDQETFDPTVVAPHLGFPHVWCWPGETVDWPSASAAGVTHCQLDGDGHAGGGYGAIYDPKRRARLLEGEGAGTDWIWVETISAGPGALPQTVAAEYRWGPSGLDAVDMYVDRVRHGISVEVDERGMPLMAGIVAGGVRHGFWWYFDAFGRPVAVTLFAHGVPVRTLDRIVAVERSEAYCQ